MFHRQQAFPQPNTLTGLGTHCSKVLLGLTWHLDLVIRFLAQHIPPMPRFQLAHHFHRPKFTITDQTDRDVPRHQPIHVAQQSQLPIGGTVSFRTPHTRPNQWNSASPISQENNQQLMPEADFGPVGNQADLRGCLTIMRFRSTFQAFLARASQPNAKLKLCLQNRIETAICLTIFKACGPAYV